MTDLITTDQPTSKFDQAVAATFEHYESQGARLFYTYTPHSFGLEFASPKGPERIQYISYNETDWPIIDRVRDVLFPDRDH